MTEIQSAVRGYLYSGDRSLLVGYPKRSDTWRSRLVEVDRFDTDVPPRLQQAQRRAGEGWLTAYGDPVASRVAFDRFRDANAAVGKSLDDQVRVVRAEADSLRRDVLVQLALASAVAVGLAVVGRHRAPAHRWRVRRACGRVPRAG